MSLLFLVALLAGLGGAYLYLTASEEVPRILAIAIFAIGFILALVQTPWPLQLLILMLVQSRHPQSSATK